VTLTVADQNGQMVPRSMNPIQFRGKRARRNYCNRQRRSDGSDPFSRRRIAMQFNGLALAIVRAKRGQGGNIIVVAKSDGLEEARIYSRSKIAAVSFCIRACQRKKGCILARAAGGPRCRPSIIIMCSELKGAVPTDQKVNDRLALFLAF